jgi:hypothetical protein
LWSTSARAEECEAMIGALELRNTSAMQASEACETSTSMPSALARATAAAPNSLRPALGASPFSGAELPHKSLLPTCTTPR